MIDDLENRVNEIWGEGQFNWTIGGSPEGWFYFCGTAPEPYEGWLHAGHAPTISAALEAMIERGSPDE